MAKKILTNAQADYLYKHGLAFLEGNYGLTTRTAFYQWIPNDQVYEATHTGLKVVHNLGAIWNGTRFVRCTCTHCERYPEHAANVEIYGEP